MNDRDNKFTDLRTYEKYLSLIYSKETFLLFLSSESCKVCHDDKKVVQKIISDKNLKAYRADIEKNVILRGQLSVFTGPTIILFAEGKEFYRKSRFIDFNELESKICELKNILE